MTWEPHEPGKQIKETLMTKQNQFWEKVKPSPSSECWEWTGCKDSNGYGRVMIDGIRKRAHRYALIFATGHDCADLEALHACDNPVCCNPKHLRWGTHKDNMADRRDRNRGFIPAGSRHGSAKLDDAAASRIKFGGESARELMAEYSVSKSVIYHIRQGRSWTHIGPH